MRILWRTSSQLLFKKQTQISEKLALYNSLEIQSSHGSCCMKERSRQKQATELLWQSSLQLISWAKVTACVPTSSPSQLRSKSRLDHSQSSYTLHSSVKIYQLITDTSLKPQECNLLQLSVHICSDRQTLQTKNCFKHLCQSWGLFHSLNKPHFLPCADTKGKDRQLAERHEATEMCKTSKSRGKIPSSIPPHSSRAWDRLPSCFYLLSHAEWDTDQAAFRQPPGCPVNVLSDIHWICK